MLMYNLRPFSTSQPWAIWCQPRATWHLVVALSCPFCLVSARLSWLYDISDAHADSCGHMSSLPSMHCTWTCLLPSSMSPMQFMQHFCWGICILFTLSNRYISYYATNAIYTACQGDLQANIHYPRIVKWFQVQQCNTYKSI